jgi:hypothetical protein
MDLQETIVQIFIPFSSFSIVHDTFRILEESISSSRRRTMREFHSSRLSHKFLHALRSLAFPCGILSEERVIRVNHLLDAHRSISTIV